MKLADRLKSLEDAKMHLAQHLDYLCSLFTEGVGVYKCKYASVMHHGHSGGRPTGLRLVFDVGDVEHILLYHFDGKIEIAQDQCANHGEDPDFVDLSQLNLAIDSLKKALEGL